jgi:hypothetical protein
MTYYFAISHFISLFHVLSLFIKLFYQLFYAIFNYKKNDLTLNNEMTYEEIISRTNKELIPADIKLNKWCIVCKYQIYLYIFFKNF